MNAAFTAVNAVSGTTTATVSSGIAAWVAAQHVSLDWVLVNLGTNDLPGIRAGTLTQAAWLTAMGNVLDTVHTAWPLAKVRLARVYRSDYMAEADVLDDTWIPNVLTSRSAWAAVGPDERTFLPGNVSDTTHPTPTGYVLQAGQWLTTIGY